MHLICSPFQFFSHWSFFRFSLLSSCEAVNDDEHFGHVFCSGHDWVGFVFVGVLRPPPTAYMHWTEASPWGLPDQLLSSLRRVHVHVRASSLHLHGPVMKDRFHFTTVMQACHLYASGQAMFEWVETEEACMYSVVAHASNSIYHHKFFIWCNN